MKRTIFAKLVVSAFKDAGVGITAVHDADFSLTTDESSTVYLDNVYARHSAANRKDRAAILDTFVRSVAERQDIPDQFEAVSARLMPVLRSVNYISAVRLMSVANGGAYATPRTETLVGEIEIGLAYDNEHSISHICKSDFDKWEIPFDQALAVATANLNKVSGLDGFSEESFGLYKATWNDSYDSSRMLLPDLIRRLTVQGYPVAFIPNRDHLWICGSDDELAIMRMLESAGESLFEPYALSEKLFILRGTDWTVFEPSPTIAGSLNELQRRRADLDYRQQTSDLMKLLEGDAINVYPAAFTSYEMPDGAIYTSCVWSKGIPSLLPKTDRIRLFINSENKDILDVPWEALTSHFPELLVRERGFFPHRFNARNFPTEEHLRMLRQLAASGKRESIGEIP